MIFLLTPFARVNDPIFGRWVTDVDHYTWHNEAVPNFNDYWAAFRQEEEERVLNGGAVFSIEEILQKLAAARSEFPVSNGN